MGMTYTKMRPTAPAEIQMNAGVILTEFVPATGLVDTSKILASTTGGISVTAVPSYVDFGDDIDNCPKNMKEFKDIESIEVKASATALTITADLAKFLAGAADIETVESADHSVTKIVPRQTLLNADFQDLWIVGDRGKGGQGGIAVHLMNALNTGGFSMQTADKGKGQFAMDITGHYEMANPEDVPYEIYIIEDEQTP